MTLEAMAGFLTSEPREAHVDSFRDGFGEVRFIGRDDSDKLRWLRGSLALNTESLNIGDLVLLFKLRHDVLEIDVERDIDNDETELRRFRLRLDLMEGGARKHLIRLKGF